MRRRGPRAAAGRLTSAVVLTVAVTGLTAGPAQAVAPSPEGYTLFGGNDILNGVSYDSFRIPAIVSTTPGSLVAFAEGRRNSESDWGDIDLVMKTSADNGATWSGLQPVATGGTDTWGNPTPVYNPNSDPATGGTIWLFAQRTDGTVTSTDQTTWDNREVYGLSKQVGADGVPTGSWTFKNLNSTLKPAGYKWDAIGPGNGIRLTQSGPDRGALVIPAWGRNIYSKDGGTTWQQSALPSRDGVEGTVSERTDGSLYRNDRPGSGSGFQPYRRFLSGTLTGGYTAYQWHDGTHDTLTEPTSGGGCQGSVLRYNFDGRHRLMFLHPSDATNRRKMMISISYDNGATWDEMSRLIPHPTGWGGDDPVEGGYSSMAKTSDYHVAALIEGSKADPSDPSGTGAKEHFIVFHKFNLNWILNGRTEP
ncbi:sialidase family protein [Actinoplanes regularis]|uniref:exo-alpha-sialidase n=1 Tax=Actinoplanes regularis TaxID=52697 RepID=A0A239F3X6_9ACTN|nr:sialidase family protein [Actinoplanes regularis]SNS51535.1 sialidase-1 [Actinoplanes regularis]